MVVDRLERVCGFHAVASLLKREPKRIQQLLIDRGRKDPRMQEIQSVASAAGVRVNQADRKALDKAADGIRHQGLVALARPAPQQGDHALFEHLDAIDGSLLILILDQVQDPHNLGACLRSADGAGVDAVIVPKDGAAPVNETVRRVAAGAADRVGVYYVTNLSRVMQQLSERGIWMTGAADEAEAALWDVDLNGNTALVLGAEGKGLRRLTRERCDQMVSIPMAGAVASLNVSVATGVLLFEAVRQRRTIAARGT